MFAVTDQSCSSDGDCPQAQCIGTDYYVDQDGSGTCTYDERDGEDVCGGYDKVYTNAEICGGRYNYQCDSSGCDGYTDGSDNDDDDRDDRDSNNDDSTGDEMDACEAHLKKCDGETIVECQDTDGDGYTDAFVDIKDCTGECNNAACIVPQETRWFPDSDGDDCTTAEVSEGSSEGYGTEQDCRDSLTDDSGIDDREARHWFTQTVHNMWNWLTGWFQ